MKTVLKWLGRAVLAIVALVAVILIVAYAVSSRILNKSYDAPAVAVAIPSDSASLAEGERFARILGCYDGCHGTEAQGDLFVDDPLFRSVKSPDLT